MARENVIGTLLRVFQSRFEVLNADTPELIRQAQRIRYQAYCVENSLEKDNAEGIETDEFDSQAAHSLLVARATATALGTVRLIMPRANAPERSFAVQRLLDPSSARRLLSLPIHTMAEASRFSISRHFRRLMADSEPVETDSPVISNSGPMMRLGLFQGLMRMSLQHGITHWCALMEPTLIRMFSAMAIRFQPIGPLVEFRGLRQPCYIDVYAMLNGVMREHPAFWEIVTDGGALSSCMAGA
jgi:N-acyl amino acid synthase of PEP-CTERM/exosortase system